MVDANVIINARIATSPRMQLVKSPRELDSQAPQVQLVTRTRTESEPVSVKGQRQLGATGHEATDAKQAGTSHPKKILRLPDIEVAKSAASSRDGNGGSLAGCECDPAEIGRCCAAEASAVNDSAMLTTPN
jgi:hypothetical protein